MRCTIEVANEIELIDCFAFLGLCDEVIRCLSQ
jgi:hypothetical protein